MIIKDSMVLIHLAKISLLAKSCDYFRDVIIPQLVYDETSKTEKDYPEIKIINELIEKKKMKVKKVTDMLLLEKANQYNIQRGEAESVALYWQEKADFLATDDDNVRKKKIVLDLNVIGTPAIILKLYNEKIIDKDKLKEGVSQLRKIGWFSNAILDKVLMEGLK